MSKSRYGTQQGRESAVLRDVQFLRESEECDGYQDWFLSTGWEAEEAAGLDCCWWNVGEGEMEGGAGRYMHGESVEHLGRRRDEWELLLHGRGSGLVYLSRCCAPLCLVGKCMLS